MIKWTNKINLCVPHWWAIDWCFFFIHSNLNCQSEQVVVTLRNSFLLKEQPVLFMNSKVSLGNVVEEVKLQL